MRCCRFRVQISLGGSHIYSPLSAWALSHAFTSPARHRVHLFPCLIASGNVGGVAAIRAYTVVRDNPTIACTVDSRKSESSYWIASSGCAHRSFVLVSIFAMLHFLPAKAVVVIAWLDCVTIQKLATRQIHFFLGFGALGAPRPFRVMIATPRRNQ